MVERDGGVAVLRLNRTDKHNAFNRELASVFQSALEALEDDAAVVCVVLTGAGSAFCAGADMQEAVAQIADNGRSDGMGASIGRAATFSKPLVACVNGPAYGGGALLAAVCDIRIAAAGARFRFPGAAYGLVVGGSQLPRIVGAAYAKELMFTGRVVDAEEALRMGLVNAVEPPERAFEATMEMARMIAANSLEALVATKQVVDRALDYREAARLEADANARLRQSPEHHARFRAAADRVARRE